LVEDEKKNITLAIWRRVREVPKNSAEGFPGLDLNSGWN
jgi:hypothetical protein